MKIVQGIYLPDRDIHFSEQILQNPLYLDKGTYQFRKLVTSVQFCKSFNTAIDIGANVGLWTRVLAHIFKKVVAVEPIEENVECLRLNANFNNVEIAQTAISNVTGLLSLKYTEGAATSYVVNYEDRDLEVPCHPLDDFDFDDVSFIKIDVEGYEQQVVQSGEKIIRKCKPTIIVEQKKKRLLRYGDDKHQPTVRLLESWGAHEVWFNSGDHCLAWEI